MYGFQEVQHIDIGKNLADKVFKIDSEKSLHILFEYVKKITLTLLKLS